MDIAARIRLARERAQWSQKQLAKKLRIGQSAISQWESGMTKPDIQNRLKLSLLLKIPFSELLPETQEVSGMLIKNPTALRLLQQFDQLTPADQEVVLMLAAALAEKHRASG